MKDIMPDNIRDRLDIMLGNIETGACKGYYGWDPIGDVVTFKDEWDKQ
jgi:hypothetical protein